MTPTPRHRHHIRRIAVTYALLLVLALILSIVRADDRAFWYSVTALSGAGNLLPFLLE